MSKRKVLIKNQLKMPTGDAAGISRELRGSDREDITGLSEEAVQRMERLDASSRRAAQRLGQLRVC